MANKLVNEEEKDDFSDEEPFEKEEEKDEFSDDFEEASDKKAFEEEGDEKEVKVEEPKEDKVLEAARDKQELAALKKMLKALGKSYNPKVHDGYMLMRFLRARQLDPVKAITMMNARLVCFSFSFSSFHLGILTFFCKP